MKIYHTKQSGFIINTDSNNVVLFDTIIPRESIPTEYLLGEYTTVFISHPHSDHWRTKLLDEFENAHFFIDEGIFVPKISRITPMQPKQSAGNKGLTVFTYGSTDQGVSFVVSLENGETILHCGDLNWWHWKSFNPTQQEQEELSFKEIVNEMIDTDITYAFVPVDPRLEDASTWAAQYIIDTLNPMYLIPMHCFDHYEEMNHFAEALDCKDTKILPVIKPNSLVYSN